MGTDIVERVVGKPRRLFSNSSWMNPQKSAERHDVLLFVRNIDPDDIL